MLISIDHGNKQIKTIHCNPFTSGLTESDVQPYGRDVLKYREKYYQISDQRIHTTGTRRRMTVSLF